MKFIIGLGNPEKKYERTRHNAGFKVLDVLSPDAAWKMRNDLWALVAPYAEGVHLVKPQTYMNETGQALGRLTKKYGVKPQALLVVTDDANLDLGKLRLRASGSSGGHHGLESAIEHLGSGDFPRLRVGIRSVDMPKDLPDFVLGRFAGSEEKIFKEAASRAASVCEAWASGGMTEAAERLSRLQNLTGST